MLSRERRVSRRQFPLILKASRSLSTPVLSLRIATRSAERGQKPTSFAFIVSRQVAGRAVDRNRLKRRARAVVRELLPMVKDNYGCLLFFKPGATTLSYVELKKLIQEILTRASLLTG
ncbi:MAG: ribonuclease P protein component [Patescibacteria group bacterium]